MPTDDELLLVRVEAQISKFEKAMAKASGTSTRAAKKIESDFLKLERKLDGVGRNAFSGLLGALAGFIGARAIFGAFVTNTEAAEKATAQLQAVLKSTGGVSRETLESLQGLATALQRTTTFDDEAVQGAEALLLTFTRIGRETFPEATSTVLDMSTALGQDLKSSAIQVGKALNDPIRGITTLRKVGVSFSQEQINQIRNFVKLGEVSKAQAVILRELQTEFGGSAVAARDTLGGAIQSLGNAWGELFELQGPAAEGLKTSINELVKIISDSGFKEDVAAIGAALFQGLSSAATELHGFISDVRELKALFPELGTGGTDSFTDIQHAAEAAARSVEDFFSPIEAAGATTAAGLSDARAVLENIPAQIENIQQAAKDGLIPPDESERQIAFLSAQLAALQGQLQSLTNTNWVVNVELHRASEDASMAALEQFRNAGTGGAKPPPPPHPSPPPPPSGGGGKSPREKFDDDIARIKERTEALRIETELVGKSTHEAERARAVQDLLNQARRDGLKITPKVRSEIEAEAEAYANAATSLEETQKRFDAVNELGQAFGESVINDIEGLADKTMTLNDVLADTAKMIRHAALEAVILGQGPLATLLGLSGSGGGLGGIIGKVIGSLGGRAPGAAPLAAPRIPTIGSAAVRTQPTIVQIAVDEGVAFVPRVRAISGQVAIQHVTRGNAAVIDRVRRSGASWAAEDQARFA